MPQSQAWPVPAPRDARQHAAPTPPSTPTPTPTSTSTSTSTAAWLHSPRCQRADRSRPIRPRPAIVWRAWLRLVRALLLAAALLGLGQPAFARAQTDDNPNRSAWWARVNTVDDATACAAEAALVHAGDVESRAEFDLSTDSLSTVLTGPELTRESQIVAALEEQGHGLDRAGYRSWRTMGGTPDDVVLYVSSTNREGDWDPAADRVTDNQWVETGQTAFRLVRQDGTWRVADRYDFETRRRPIDAAEFDAVDAAYRQLWGQLADAYDARDLDGLVAVLSGQPLETYQRRVQALLDEGKVEHLRPNGQVGVIDVDDGVALVFFEGTLITVEVDQATGQEQAPAAPDEPVVLLEQLVLDDGHWKIADEVLPDVQRAADGTVTIAGCGDTPS